MITWSETRARLRRDRERLLARFAERPEELPRPLWMHPSWQCVVLQRLSFFFASRGSRLLGRLFWHWNLLLTGADIAMVSDFGPGLIVLVPSGCVLVCNAGRDLTLQAMVGVGGGTSRNTDIGAGPGVPSIGDRVELGWNSLILGPVRIGDGARVGALALITRDVNAGAIVPDGARWTREER